MTLLELSAEYRTQAAALKQRIGELEARLEVCREKQQRLELERRLKTQLERAGASVEEYDDAVRVWRSGEILPVNIKTAPHPGFPTDMQSLMGVLLCRANGTSIITESVWESRFRYVDELLRMGANIQVNGKVAVFEGVPELQAAPVRATDLRAGAAMIMAALVAEGTTEIEDIEHIDRGYEDIVEKLSALGADIRRVEFVQSGSINQVG